MLGRVLSFLAFLKRIPFGFKLSKINLLIKFMLRGFVFNNVALYQLGKNDYQYYITDYFRFVKQARVVRKELIHLVKNKALFSYLLVSKGFNTPVLRGVFSDGQLHWYGEVTDEEFVSKPVSGSGGRGVQRFKVNDSAHEFSEGDLIFDCVKAHSYAKNIYPGSLNTMRILAYKDSEGWFFPFSVHRFGTKKSGSTDNWGGGGVNSFINSKTGELGKLACRGRGGVIWRDTHPDTKQRVQGVIIPNWKLVLKEVELASESLKVFDFLAWDVALNEKSEIVFIEANHVTDVDLIQVHGGMLDSPRVKQFYKDKGML